MKMKVLENNGITTPRGFKAVGEGVGLRKHRRDLAIIYSERPAVCSAVFTTNIVKAAPVLLDMETIKKKKNVTAIVINSGNANACTGKVGYENSVTTAKVLAELLNVSQDEILVSSTGIIGHLMDMDTLINGIRTSVLKLDAGAEADKNCAEAIMTTDTKQKVIAVEINIDGTTVKIAGVCKGSGMIRPNMATMLAYFTTDVDISRELLDKSFKYAIKKSFNRITVDGETSTNDTAIVLANAMASNRKIIEEDENYRKFSEALTYVCVELAKKIAEDGEGATKLLQINIKNAKSENDADLIFDSVANSSLVKTAFFGEDANWGRIVQTMGKSGVEFNIDKTKIIFKSKGGEILLFDKGTPIDFNEEKAKIILQEKTIEVIIDLGEGDIEIIGWTCDLSYDYIKINGSYRT
jgi:glutamate N-acetyltransferase/amino-acid N-acetyltransferase